MRPWLAALALLAAPACKKPTPPAIDLGAERDRPGLAIYAVQYARSAGVPAGELLAGEAGERRVDMSWHFYLLVGDGQIVAVDTGTDQLAKRPSMRERWSVVAADTVAGSLARVGLEPGDVDVALLTHGHFDHADGIATMSRAEIYASDPEWESMTRPDRKIREVAERAAARRRRDRPGVDAVEARIAGRHTRGHTVYVARCRDGRRLALAGDAAYLYANLERGVPVAVATSRRENLADLKAMAAELGPANVVPGHDPEVFSRFTRIGDRVARLCP